MNFLPIVERELRVAARRWTTFLIRGGVGLLALVLAVPGLFFGWLTGGGTAAGQSVFALLSHYIFVVALSGGALITADCLSSEKREGTLGLLFLTDLHGYDVVLGKFAAMGLHSMYGLLAVFPALALPLLIGGVTGAEFWRVALALLNLLFVSLSLGMAVSAASRQAGRAFSATLGLMLLLVAGLPLALGILRVLGAPGWIQYVAWANPGHAFTVGRDASLTAASGEFWGGLVVSHLLAWMLLVLAALMVPRAWQDKESVREARGAGGLVGRRVARIFRVNRSPAVLHQDPLLWLMGERPVLKLILWVLSGFWCLSVILICLVLGPDAASGVVFGWSLVLLLIIGVMLIEHSCRFWVESRQNGNLEALLAIPVQNREILSSHWASIRDHFLWPIVVVACSATVPLWIVMLRRYWGDAPANSWLPGEVMGLATVGGAIFCWFVATFAAIGYTGMWLSLKLRRPHFASGLTLLCVIILPTLFCYLGFGLTLLFIFLPMSLLHSSLRGMILQRYMAGGIAKVTRAS
jgi:ABC-type transport system involved in multi-copper enzyme maturation permease subunit